MTIHEKDWAFAPNYKMPRLMQVNQPTTGSGSATTTQPPEPPDDDEENP